MKDHSDVIEALESLDCVSEVESKSRHVTVWTDAHLDSDSPRIYAIGELDDDGKTVWNVLFETIDEAGCRVKGAGLNEKRNQFCVHVEERDND